MEPEIHRINEQNLLPGIMILEKIVGKFGMRYKQMQI